jgi:aminopeptidase N
VTRAPLAAACALAALTGAARAQQRGIDVQDYHFSVILPDTGATIRVSATIGFRRDPGAGDTLALDLVGMTVDSVANPVSAQSLRFAYDGRTLRVPMTREREQSLIVTYHGVARDGLVARTTARGRRSFFGDNWPNRARYWLATMDHPSDKASVSWLIDAPPGWVVVANGRCAPVPGRPRSTRCVERAPIPTYTMVLGATQMTVSRHRPAISARDTIPIEVWTYPEDSAFADGVPFRRATEIVETLTRIVGPFPYEKLAHVESSTRYGGMENSSAIFYAERSYARRTMGEGVVRHETAHQWFGDAVTEREWPHVWLSEGFASYFDLVAGAALGGDSVLARGMRRNLESYLRSSVVSRPMVDTAEADPNRLLNANAYQKGAWVLHMLRGLVGDEPFFRGIRDYYAAYRDSSVLSEQFQRTMERVAGRPLDRFFQQWLYQPGYPQLEVRWELDNAGRVTLHVRQVQPEGWGRFHVLQVPVRFSTPAGTATRSVALEATEAVQTFGFDLGTPPTEVRIDPDTKLLLTATVRGPEVR